MRIKKAAITAAGLDTRLLPMNREIPEEMLPIFARGNDGNVHLKPVLWAIYEQLHDEALTSIRVSVARIEGHYI